MSATQLSLLDYLEHQQAARPRDFIPVYTASLGSREESFVLDAVRSGWISSLGEYVGRFERDFAAFCGVAEGISVANGTVALHLALHALGIGPGDEVITPALTFVATANAIHYTGATPVFADVDPHSWTIDPQEIERLITPRTRAILPVHLYGHWLPAMIWWWWKTPPKRTVRRCMAGGWAVGARWRPLASMPTKLSPPGKAVCW